MKKIIFILIVIFGVYFYFNNRNTETRSVSELSNGKNQSELLVVKGKVVGNFKLFFGVYELEDINSGESIMVSTKGDLPKLGSAITVKLKRNDVITINDKTFSLFEEIE